MNSKKPFLSVGYVVISVLSVTTSAAKVPDDVERDALAGKWEGVVGVMPQPELENSAIWVIPIEGSRRRSFHAQSATQFHGCREDGHPA